MAAKNTTVSCSAGAWTQVSDETTGNVSVMLAGNVPVSLQATTDTTTPTDDTGPLHLLTRGDGWSEATIEAKFPGVASAAYLWAKPLIDREAHVSISHAAEA